MQYIRKSASRGRVDLGWLRSKHTFSFGHYHDPNHMGISVLRVINDDTVMPGRGFDTHGHQDMEIISYVTSGALKHEDSEGNKHIVVAGDVQIMSAGTGVTHSEYNASNTEEVTFFQIWIRPNKRGLTPSYQQQHIEQTSTLTTLVSSQGSCGALSINQDVSLHRLILNKNESHSLRTKDRVGYLHIVKGQALINTQLFEAGDGFSINTQQALNIDVKSNMFEALWFELPASHDC